MATKKASDLTIGEILSKLKPSRGKRPKGGLIRSLLKLLIILYPALVVWGAVKSTIVDMAAQHNYILSHPVAAGQPVPTVEPHFNVWSGWNEPFVWLWDLVSWLAYLPPAFWLVGGGIVAGLGIAWAIKRPRSTTPTP